MALLAVLQNDTFKTVMRLIDHSIQQEVDRTGQCKTRPRMHARTLTCFSARREVEVANLFRQNSVAPRLLTRFAMDVARDYLVRFPCVAARATLTPPRLNCSSRW
jgi:hypothetical protein